ncbi:MAG: hypothetical protein ACREL3_01575 [Gemmatimonadales bacterium]
MRIPFGNRPRVEGVVSAAPLLAAFALLLTACSGDSTAPVANPIENTSVTAFASSPQAAAAVRTAATRWSHKLPIVSARGVPAEGFSASQAAPPVSSPFDLTYFGGAVVNKATSYNIYVNCEAGPATCWGTNSLTPGTFLRDLNHDGFIRMVNEFIETDAKNHFPVKELSTTFVLSEPNTATIDDVLNILFSAASFTGAVGYNAIYHVYLPQGTDMCFDPTTCYSPDNFDTFVFCAFHSSVDFGPDAHVLFTVEPFQDVPGCAIPGQTPHGTIDATASTVSHELMETITDPDGDAWFNGLFGFEGSDICSSLGSNEFIGNHQYFIQNEYSNKAHGCTRMS